MPDRDFGEVPAFGPRLIALLKEEGVTNRELAQALDVSESQVSRWRGKINPPDTTTLIKIADYFRITLDELVGREGRGAASWSPPAEAPRGPRGTGGRHPADVQGGAPDQESPGRGRGTRRAG